MSDKHYIKFEKPQADIVNIEATLTYHATPKKRGRPAGSAKQNKDVQLWTRLTPEDYKKLQDIAETEGHSPSSLARKFILNGLKSQILDYNVDKIK